MFWDIQQRFSTYKWALILEKVSLSLQQHFSFRIQKSHHSRATETWRSNIPHLQVAGTLKYSAQTLLIPELPSCHSPQSKNQKTFYRNNKKRRVWGNRIFKMCMHSHACVCVCLYVCIWESTYERVDRFQLHQRGKRGNAWDITIVKFMRRNSPTSCTSFHIQSHHASLKIFNKWKSIFELTEIFYLLDRKKKNC